MADDDDIETLNEEENELDRLLQENGQDPAEYSLDEKRELANDQVGTTGPSSSTDSSEPDPTNDDPAHAIPPEERDS